MRVESWQPHRYQMRAMELMVRQGAAGLFLDPGLGKTSISLGAFQALRKQGLVRRMLVIAPLRVCHQVWPAEIRRWEQFSDLRVQVLHGSAKEARLQQDADVYVLNPEGLPWLLENKAKLDPWPELLVVDESTKFKHSNTVRFKLLRQILPSFKRRYILTGTPAPNGLMDLFGQVFILDLGASLGRFITHYRNAFFYPSGYGGYDWVPQPDAQERIYKRLQPLVLRLAAEDYLELPAKIETTIPVELPKKAMQMYKILERDFLLQLRKGEVTAANAGVLTSKLRQAANGGIYVDGQGRDWAALHTSKDHALEDLLSELSHQPTLIAFEFRHDRERIVKKLVSMELSYGVLDGETTAKQGKELEAQWNAGQLEALVVHPQSAAHGLNLQAGGHALVWYALPWNLELYDQLVRRLWRQGQEQRVFVYHLVAEGTIDGLVQQTLAQKDKTQRSLLEALQRRGHGKA